MQHVPEENLGMQCNLLFFENRNVIYSFRPTAACGLNGTSEYEYIIFHLITVQGNLNTLAIRENQYRKPHAGSQTHWSVWSCGTYWLSQKKLHTLMAIILSNLPNLFTGRLFNKFAVKWLLWVGKYLAKLQAGTWTLCAWTPQC